MKKEIINYASPDVKAMNVRIRGVMMASYASIEGSSESISSDSGEYDNFGTENIGTDQGIW